MNKIKLIALALSVAALMGMLASCMRGGNVTDSSDMNSAAGDLSSVTSDDNGGIVSDVGSAITGTTSDVVSGITGATSDVVSGATR